MSPAQLEKVIVLAEQMIANNYKLITNLSMMTPSEQLHYYPHVMKSISESQRKLNALISESKPELNPYQQWQAAKYGNILPEPIIWPSGHTEASEEEINRQAEWVNEQAQQQLLEHEK